jgi:hypothetical protein
MSNGAAVAHRADTFESQADMIAIGLFASVSDDMA